MQRRRRAGSNVHLAQPLKRAPQNGSTIHAHLLWLGELYQLNLADTGTTFELTLRMQENKKVAPQLKLTG